MDTNNAQNVQAGNQNAASQLLASLKANLGSGSAQDGLFANLLAEAGSSVPVVKPAQPKAEVAAPVAAPTQRDDKTVTTSDKHTESLAGSTSQDRAPTRRAGDKKEQVKKADKQDQADQADPKAQTQEAKEVPEQADKKVEAVQDTQKETKVDEAVAADEEKKTEDAALMELLAALCPLDEGKTVVAKADGDTKVQSEESTDAAALIDSEVMALAQQQKDALTAQMQDGEGKAEKAEAHKIKTAIAGALNVKAEHRAAQNDNAQATTDLTAGANEAVVAQSETATTTQSGLGDLSGKGGKAAGHEAQAQTTAQTQNQQSSLIQPFGVVAQGAQQSAAPAKAAAGSAVQDIVKLADAAGAAKTTTPMPTGEGVRASSGYDFASQLSALRATKGGATGLPQAVEQVAVQLHKMAKEGSDEITIQLKPVELGKIEIKLEIKADKTVQGTVVVENQATLNMLSKDASSLQRALQDAGLQADAGSLSFSLKGDGQNQFAGNQNQSQGRPSSFAYFDESGDAGLYAPTAYEESYITPGRVNLKV